MIAFLARRLLSAAIVILMVAAFVFSLLYITPGDPAAIIAGDQASPAQVEKIRLSLRLDEPFLIRFGEWLWQVMRGDLGVSIYSGRPIAFLISQRVEVTVSLMLVAMTISVLVAIPLGVLAAWRHDSWIDRSVMVASTLGFSVPVFVVGYILAYVFGLKIRWFPVQGYTPVADGILPWLRGLALPGAALSLGFIGLLARMTRAAMLQILSQDYVRTAKAKGLGSGPILFGHALRNVAVPVTTVVGLGVAGLLSGAVVTESVFALPGLGRLTSDAILRRDYPVIQSMILVFSLNYVLINLIVDLLYSVFDPRVRTHG